jgi:hypothetical protein
LDNTYIWLQYDHFGCNWNQLHLSFLVERWLQLELCNSLRQPFDVVLQQIFLLQRTRNYIATNTWLLEQTLQRTNLPNATNTSLQDQILQRTT